MRTLIKSAVVLLIATLGIQTQAAEYLVKYKNQTGLSQLKSMASQKNLGMTYLQRHAKGSYILVDLDKTQQLVRLAELVNNPMVEWVVPNFKLYAVGLESNDPFKFETAALREQWSLQKIQAPQAWERAGNKGSKSITVAVIDTGVDYRHADLAPNMVAGYDFRDNDSDPMDETSDKNPGHGTHCAGITAASGLIENGIAGGAPGVSIMPIRFLGADGSGDLNGGIRSIDFAIEKGAQIISASWGASVPENQAGPLVEAVQRADDKGVIFIAAAANDGANNDTRPMYPANANTPNMIAVAASTVNDVKPQWSNYGKAKVHLSSPGENIMSTLPGNKYGNLSGTSMATPLVSGIVAFLKSQTPGLTGAQIRALLQTTGQKVEIETACNCRVDEFAAVDHLLSKKTWIVPAAATLAEGSTLSLSVMNAVAPISFSSSNPGVATVDANGVLTAVAKGSTIVSAKDANGAVVTSLDYNVGVTESAPGGACPFEDPTICTVLCGVYPELPFCQ